MASSQLEQTVFTGRLQCDGRKFHLSAGGILGTRQKRRNAAYDGAPGQLLVFQQIHLVSAEVVRSEVVESLLHITGGSPRRQTGRSESLFLQMRDARVPRAFFGSVWSQRSPFSATNANRSGA